MIWILLIAFQIKHWVCDFPLQGKYMLGKFKEFPDCLLPLASHSAVHGVATYLIATVAGSNHAGLLCMLDFVIHGVVDYLKANPKIGGRFKPLTKDTFPSATPEQIKSNTYFWWALGMDQTLHHLTHYLIIWCLLQ